MVNNYLIDAYNHTGYAQVFEEYDGVNRTYTIGDDVISQYDGTSVGHFLYDGLGSVRQLTNSSGNVVADQVFNYDAYGVLLGYTGTPQTNLRYTGEYYDTALKQYNLRARYYDPLNGRFNQTDSYSGNNHDPQSLHKYLYCHANPVNAIDPSGNFDYFITSIAILIGVAIVATTYFVGYKGIYQRLYRGWWRPLSLEAQSHFMNEELLKTAVDEMMLWPVGHRMRDCADWLAPAEVANNQVKVFPGGESDLYGMHNIASPYLFVCQWVVDNQNALDIAVVIFGEWQHHTAGGKMNEAQAQAEFRGIQDDLRKNGKITPFIANLAHGVK